MLRKQNDTMDSRRSRRPEQDSDSEFSIEDSNPEAADDDFVVVNDDEYGEIDKDEIHDLLSSLSQVCRPYAAQPWRSNQYHPSLSHIAATDGSTGVPPNDGKRQIIEILSDDEDIDSIDDDYDDDRKPAARGTPEKRRRQVDENKGPSQVRSGGPTRLPLRSQEGMSSSPQGSDSTVPDPSFARIAEVLHCIETETAPRIRNDPKNRLRRLGNEYHAHKIFSWLEQASGDKSRSIKLRNMLLDLGAPSRLLSIMQKHVHNLRFVHYAGQIVVFLLTHIDDEEENTDDSSTLRNLVYRLTQQGAFRSLALMLNQLSPANGHDGCEALHTVWMMVHQFMHHSRHFLSFDEAYGVMIAGEDIVIDPGNVFIDYRLGIMSLRSLVRNIIIDVCDDHDFVQSATGHMIFDWAVVEGHQSAFLNSTFSMKGMFLLSARLIEKGALTHHAIFYWVPLISVGVSRWFMDNEIETEAYKFLSQAVDQLDHRQLVMTKLVQRIMVIVGSDLATDEVKRKYRELIVKVMSDE